MFVRDVAPIVLQLFAALWGALWGSFFNVCIYRWPRGMSVVSPPSHCPACSAPIPAWRNLPVLAYVLQRGKAACCGAPMTPRYLVVELLSGLLCVAAVERVMVGHPEADLVASAIEALILFAFLGGLVIATFVDFEHLEIPDEVSLGGAALGLATLPLRHHADPVDLALGAGAAYLFIMILPVWSWERITGQRGMGEGDAKLLMMIGAFLGWQGVLFALAAASLQGALAYVVLLAWRARTSGPEATDPQADEDDETVEVCGAGTLEGRVEVDLPGVVSAKVEGPLEALKLTLRYRSESDRPAGAHIPFGPFLSLAAIEFAFFGDRIVDWYTTQFFG